MRRLGAGWMALFAASLCVRVASAEVVTDGSLNPSQMITPVANQYLITEDLGRHSGVNLFHSFSLFNIEAVNKATFTATLPTERVIARVTGGTRSQINGRLATAGTAVNADLFLLNPAGVTFGPSASVVDLGGSFYVSTAQLLRFDTGEVFDATPTPNPPPDLPLSIAAPSAFGFVTDHPESIRFNQTVNLRLPVGETFSIIGGPVLLTGFNRTAIWVPSGRIQIAAVDRASDVPLDLAQFGGEALASAVVADEIPDVTLDQGFFLDVSGDVASAGPVGQVVIRGGSLAFSGSRIDAAHRSAQDATAPAIDIEMVNGVDLGAASRLTSQASGAGRGGSISIDAPQVSVHDTNTILQTQTIGAGAGGELRISAVSIVISGGGIVRSLGRNGHGWCARDPGDGRRAWYRVASPELDAGRRRGRRDRNRCRILDVSDGGHVLAESSAEGRVAGS
jgi:filamentous hemagglutinin family protein